MTKFNQFFNKLKITHILLIALILRVVAAFYSTGFNHYDEHFMGLEPAHGIVYGNWLRTWEWYEEIRSWTMPYIFASMMYFGKFFGITHPDSVAILIRLFCALFSILGLASIYRIVKEFIDEYWARFCTLLLSIWWLHIYFSVRTMGEPLSTTIILFGTVIAFKSLKFKKLDFDNANLKLLYLAGLIMGAAFSFRYNSGFFPLGFAFYLLLNKRIKLIFVFSAGVLSWVVIHGLIDLATWGTFLKSPVQYYIWSFVYGGAAKVFGSDPWHRYITWFIRYFTIPISLFLFYLVSVGRKKISAMSFMLLFFWLGHWVISHKEDRFLMPTIPFFFILLTSGLALLKEQGKEKKFKFVFFGVLISFIFASVYKIPKHGWQAHSDLINDYVGMYENKDVKGVIYFGNLAHSGGFFYLHKNLPYLVVDSLRDAESTHKSKDIKLSEIPSKYNTLVNFHGEPNILGKLKQIGIKCEHVAAPVWICSNN